MLSFGMFSFVFGSIAVGKRGLEFTSPPPMRAAMVISRIRRVKARPRFASVAAFLCLMVAHFECPDMTNPLFRGRCAILFGEISSRPGALPAALQLHATHYAETYGKPPTLRNPRSLAQPVLRRNGGILQLGASPCS